MTIYCYISCTIYFLIFFQEFYPVNYLRNVALKNARTNVVLLSDADFVPAGTADVHDALVNFSSSMLAISSSSPSFNGAKRALILPALETPRYQLKDVPTSKAAAVAALDVGDLYPFRYHEWSKGHAATDFGRWRAATKPYKVEWQENFEPYVMVLKKELPLFDERFVGFGWNKAS